MADDRVVVVALSVGDLRAGEKSWIVDGCVLPLRDMVHVVQNGEVL
jgi:hypothetical protein